MVKQQTIYAVTFWLLKFTRKIDSSFFDRRYLVNTDGTRILFYTIYSFLFYEATPSLNTFDTFSML